MTGHTHEWIPTHAGWVDSEDLFIIRYGCGVDGCGEEAFEMVEGRGV